MWKQLDPVLWELTHNPWTVLQTVSRERLKALLGNAAFRQQLDSLVKADQSSCPVARVVSKHPSAELT